MRHGQARNASPMLTLLTLSCKAYLITCCQNTLRPESTQQRSVAVESRYRRYTTKPYASASGFLGGLYAHRSRGELQCILSFANLERASQPQSLCTYIKHISYGCCFIGPRILDFTSSGHQRSQRSRSCTMTRRFQVGCVWYLPSGMYVLDAVQLSGSDVMLFRLPIRCFIYSHATSTPTTIMSLS